MIPNNIVITDIQRFCMHDGDGLRTTVFLKGCPLRCAWCHNPETQRQATELLFSEMKCINCGGCAAVCTHGAQSSVPNREIARDLCVSCGECTKVCPTGALTLSGKTVTADSIIETVLKDRAFYGERGGITVSGGEPTAQSEGLISLLSAAKDKGLNTAIETCGVFGEDLVEKLISLVDLFLYDIKDTDSDRFRKYTGGNLAAVKSNLSEIDRRGGKTVMRSIMIPEVNMTPDHASGLADIYKGLKNCRYIELLPYHPYGNSKSLQLGREDAVFTKPEKEDVLGFADMLLGFGVPVKAYGKMLPSRKEN